MILICGLLTPVQAFAAVFDSAVADLVTPADLKLGFYIIVFGGIFP